MLLEYILAVKVLQAGCYSLSSPKVVFTLPSFLLCVCMCFFSPQFKMQCQKTYTWKQKGSPTVALQFPLVQFLKSEIHIYQIIIYCHGNCFVMFQFHYRDEQQELMDHKKEIRCLNNGYSLYSANMERGEYKSSVTQHQEVNGSELEIEFTWQKHMSIPCIQNSYLLTRKTCVCIECQLLCARLSCPEADAEV